MLQLVLHVLTATFDCVNCALTHSRCSQATIVYANNTPTLHLGNIHFMHSHKIFKWSHPWQVAHHTFRGVVGGQEMRNEEQWRVHRETVCDSHLWTQRTNQMLELSALNTRTRWLGKALNSPTLRLIPKVRKGFLTFPKWVVFSLCLGSIIRNRITQGKYWS